MGPFEGLQLRRQVPVLFEFLQSNFKAR